MTGARTDVSTDHLFRLLSERGGGRYGLSDVTQLDHALQAADLARRRRMGDELIVAALFHDVGHLVVDEDTNLAAAGIDDFHERTSSALLEPIYGPSVAEPVRLHVAAKRYLCGATPAYFKKLSQDSRLSLELQGGPMSPDEIEAFNALPYRASALALRLIDDEAKVPSLSTPGLESYRDLAMLLERRHKARANGG